MSNAVSALQGARFEGFATITESGLRGMITLRGDLASSAVKSAVKAATGLAVPTQRQFATADEHGVGWMSPDELLLMVPYEKAPEITARLAAALEGEHALVVNVSDARAVFSIEGQSAREVLAKLSPVDVSQESFPEGTLRRTRLAQTAVAFWAKGKNAFELICFRSEAGYVFDVLSMSARKGSEVNFYST
ncbi:sarcosine oxidase subunit gamma family protein [uncultured Litoreibacter sp.]|uniref:sarcosine oxidase subunit gamma n=1 Tax=uncultured Litoreibacter sp. TaxID=1392394 RepID=UPI0026262F75|nr:sarcosine oxidase subunit gamma family protein [uncultured Litoreibacter sp.]